MEEEWNDNWLKLIFYTVKTIIHNLEGATQAHSMAVWSLKSFRKGFRKSFIWKLANNYELACIFT